MMKYLPYAGIFLLLSLGAQAAPFSFSTGNVNNVIATASRPGATEIETADDFLLTGAELINHATFTGLLVPSAAGVLPTITGVTIEIYRVFPLDSNNPPNPVLVPTRVNSPSDVALLSRDSGVGGGLTFTTSVVSNSFTASNSVLNGIHPTPNQTTGGEGAVTGQEILFDINLSTPIILPADHYFFVAQVATTNGNFFWLSAVRPLVAPGTPFAPDLQSWIRNASIDPNWLRIGADIVGGGASFNSAFSLIGFDVPEPSSLGLAFAGLTMLVVRRLRK